jgi:hypothetical protein
MTTSRAVFLSMAILLLGGAPASSQTPPPGGGAPPAGPPDAAELAKQLSNPVADLISVPFQMNWELDVGPEEDTRFVHNFQPVMPFAWNDDWNLIFRIIVPYVGQPALVPGGEPSSGVSDIVASFFFSRRSPRASSGALGRSFCCRPLRRSSWARRNLASVRPSWR